MLRNKNVIYSILAFVSIAFIILYIFVFQGLNNKIQDEIEGGDKVVLLFSASWCTSCTKLKPALSHVLEENPDLRYYEIGSNLNKLKKKVLFKKYKVYGIPTLLIFKEGKEFKRILGVKTEQELQEIFTSLN